MAKAAAKSLDVRGDLATGWAIAWRINLWARLHDAERTYKIVKLLLDPSRTYPNLFDAHGPFQIDGNFGGASRTEGRPFRVLLFQDADPSAARRAEGAVFQGDFGALIERGGKVEELYVGNGKSLTASGYALQSADGNPIKATLRREGNGWRYSADRTVTVTLPGGQPMRLPAAQDAPVAAGRV